MLPPEASGGEVRFQVRCRRRDVDRFFQATCGLMAGAVFGFTEDRNMRPTERLDSSNIPVSRRAMLRQSANTLACLAGCALSMRRAFSKDADAQPLVHTVLGSVAPDKLGVTLMHEHAPIVDWSELYETAPAPLAPVREKLL